jgi:hypothetical protein
VGGGCVGFGLSGFFVLVGVLVKFTAGTGVLVLVNVIVGVGDAAIRVSNTLVSVRFGVCVGNSIKSSSSQRPGPITPVLNSSSKFANSRPDNCSACGGVLPSGFAMSQLLASIMIWLISLGLAP